MTQRIVAIGGGGFSDAGELTPLDHHLLELTGKARPRVCFLGTASGDADRYAATFYRAYGPVAEASDLVLFGAPTADEVAGLAEQDLVFVGGGNTANMLAVWRLHGVDKVLHDAWLAGTVIAGVSAGAICWFDSCLTDSFGPGLAVVEGLGWLAGSACPHLTGEDERRPRYIEEISAGRMPRGYGIDDGAALQFVGTQLDSIVAEVAGTSASRFELRGREVVETRLEATLLTAATANPT